MTLNSETVPTVFILQYDRGWLAGVRLTSWRTETSIELKIAQMQLNFFDLMLMVADFVYLQSSCLALLIHVIVSKDLKPE